MQDVIVENPNYSVQFDNPTSFCRVKAGLTLLIQSNKVS